MPASFLIRHWKKELQVFQVNFSKLFKRSNPDEIHDLRVAVKKLRSYYKFYSILFEKNDPSLFQQTENLFAVLGKQRNLEICLELTQSEFAEKIPGLHRHFKIFLSETALRSKLALKSYKPEDLNALTMEIEQTVSQQPEELIKDKARNIFRSSIEDVRHQVHKFDDNFHLVRKKLKDVFYWTKILPKSFYFSTADVKLLDNALNCLGSAQDFDVLKKQTRQYRSGFVVKGTEEFDGLKEMEKIAEENKNKLLHEAHPIIKELVRENKENNRNVG